ncbi:uncharacterized protein LOC128896054 isoform X1 [Hylaeus anthracinus]|uniref:uncharacterized protein LOC128896054 isoform X1 n=1 Tax=Hylaeus anthracinus TaxID=313031 RepID=UPI0023BA2454|nr:uncharacterized protein LOC128896054 isoform X1 [Hylaeus anthracinus]
MFNHLCLKNAVVRADVISKLAFFYRPLAKNSKSKAPVFCKSYHSSPNCALKARSTRDSTNQRDLDIFHVNTNVQNNVILFRSKSTIATNILRCVTFGWSFGSMMLAYYTVDIKALLTWTNGVLWKEVKQAIKDNIFYIINMLIGPITAIMSHLIIRRFIRCIILHKGGKYVTLTTHHLLKKERILTIPVEEIKVNTVIKRNTYTSLKIRGKWFYFIMETDGTFYNQQLFNNTIGLAKTW